MYVETKQINIELAIRGLYLRYDPKGTNLFNLFRTVKKLTDFLHFYIYRFLAFLYIPFLFFKFGLLEMTIMHFPKNEKLNQILYKTYHIIKF